MLQIRPLRIHRHALICHQLQRPPPMDPVNNLRAAYHILERDVQRTLRTQLGDPIQLQNQRHAVLRFMQSAELVGFLDNFQHHMD